MPAVPNWLAGTLTLAAFVVLGIFLYPWLFARGRGWLVALLTLALTALFFAFDAHGSSVTVSLLLALLWAVAPVVVGVVVFRMQRSAAASDGR